MTAITNGQLELRSGETHALVIGEGTDFRLPKTSVQWWSAPEVRTSDQARSGANGYLAGRDLLGKHTTTIAVLILGTSESDLLANIDAWKLACAPSSDAMVAVRAHLLGSTRVRRGRFRIPGEVTLDEWSTDPYGVVSGTLCDVLRAYGSAQFQALDPLTYGDTLHSQSCGRAVAGAGFSVPFTPPFTLPAGTVGAFTATNSGPLPTPWIGTLAGPLAFPQITHLESGRRLALSFTANGGVDLASGETLTLNSADRSVLFNGTADRRSQLTIDSEWWDLDPGDNTFMLDADSGSGTLTVEWYDAYYS